VHWGVVGPHVGENNPPWVSGTVDFPEKEREKNKKKGNYPALKIRQTATGRRAFENLGRLTKKRERQKRGPQASGSVEPAKKRIGVPKRNHRFVDEEVLIYRKGKKKRDNTGVGSPALAGGKKIFSGVDTRPFNENGGGKGEGGGSALEEPAERPAASFALDLFGEKCTRPNAFRFLKDPWLAMLARSMRKCPVRTFMSNKKKRSRKSPSAGLTLKLTVHQEKMRVQHPGPNVGLD